MLKKDLIQGIGAIDCDPTDVEDTSSNGGDFFVDPDSSVNAALNKSEISADMDDFVEARLTTKETKAGILQKTLNRAVVGRSRRGKLDVQ